MNLFTSLSYFQTQCKKIIYSQSLKYLTSDKLKTTFFINTEGVYRVLYFGTSLQTICWCCKKEHHKSISSRPLQLLLQTGGLLDSSTTSHTPSCLPSYTPHINIPISIFFLLRAYRPLFFLLVSLYA